ncbi:hypothetical protein SAMN02787079_00788 [Lysinibacillus sp. TC-37]|nr:hypothetical protein SAMN02787078_00985 [Lysinibacillus sp. SG9]SDB10879.1 hypothetical protein SAMN02787079_00788 [Lysinibacillus sp. TC-37]SFS47787.1 hypothetical protein SAMN02787087_00793 [Lysinibacillus sp. SG55]
MQTVGIFLKAHYKFCSGLGNINSVYVLPIGVAVSVRLFLHQHGYIY